MQVHRIYGAAPGRKTYLGVKYELCYKGIGKIDGMAIATGKPVYTDDPVMLNTWW